MDQSSQLNWKALRASAPANAAELLALFGVGAPPVNVRDIYARAGVQIEEVATILDDHFSGELAFTAASARVLLVKSEPEGRKRFTLGTMLFHLLYDEPGTYVRRNGGIQDANERDALEFASELLLPMDMFAAEERRITGDKVEEQLARLFQVSAGAVRTRLQQLDAQADPLEFEDLEPLDGETLDQAFERTLKEYDSANFSNAPHDVQQFAAERRRQLLEARRCSDLHRLFPAVLRWDKIIDPPTIEEVRATVRDARELIARLGWCRGPHPILATDGYGKRVGVDSARAGRFSALGAIRRAGGPGDQVAEQLLAHVIGGRSWHDISAWNDARDQTREEVLAMFDALLHRLDGAQPDNP